MSKPVVVLGGTGMLGAMVIDVFAQDPQLDVVATARIEQMGKLARLPIEWRRFDASTATVDDCRNAINGAAWTVNCIGITKPLITDDDAFKVERAIRVNSLFPYVLAKAAEAAGVRVLQIATDCVFSGAQGNYREDSPHDALDVYGKTKSLGEVSSPNVHHLRASIIGPEPKEHKFLLDWFLGQAPGATLNGFTNHNWNGVTTLHFARVARAIVKQDLLPPKIHHLVPAGSLSKAKMLCAMASAYARGDLKINEVSAQYTIDRTLAANNPTLNAQLWQIAGYQTAPTVDQMINELAAFDVRFGPRSMAAAE